jgi:signal transduction histidine kinase
MRGPLARMARPGLPRRTVRLRLTALYGVLFLLSGAGLLAIVYALVATAPPLPIASKAVTPLPKPHPAISASHGLFDPVAGQVHTAELHQLLLRFGIALVIMAAISVLLGWVVAGRVLRPLRAMTLTTQHISAENLHRRLSLPGPRDELKDLADTIDGLLARLEEAFEAQRNFVANASHELRTPLTVTRALVQMRLRDPTATADAFRATCEEVLEAGDQQERLIESLLTLARSQRGLDHHEPVDLGAVAADVAEDLQPAAAARNVFLDLSAQSAPILGEPHLVERLVTNLIENAIRYNTADGHVHVVVDKQLSHPALQVINTGPHVSKGEVFRLLQPFQRAVSNNRASGSGGLGLGLSIVAAIAHAHGATLIAEPRPEGGLHIIVSFPCPTRAPSSPHSIRPTGGERPARPEQQHPFPATADYVTHSLEPENPESFGRLAQ